MKQTSHISEEQLAKYRGYDALLAGDLTKTGDQWFKFACSDPSYVREYLLVDEGRRDNLIEKLHLILDWQNNRDAVPYSIVDPALKLIRSVYDVVSPARFANKEEGFRLFCEGGSYEEQRYVLEEFVKAGFADTFNRHLLLYPSAAVSNKKILRELREKLPPETLERVPAISTYVSLFGYQGVGDSGYSEVWSQHSGHMMYEFVSKSGIPITSKEFHAALLLHVSTFGISSDPRLIGFSLRLFKAGRFNKMEATDQDTIRHLVRCGILKMEERSLVSMTTKTVMQRISESLDYLTYSALTNPSQYAPLLFSHPIIDAMFFCNTTPHHRLLSSGQHLAHIELKRNYVKGVKSCVDDRDIGSSSIGEFTIEVPGQRRNRYLTGIVTNDFPQRISPQILGLCFANGRTNSIEDEHLVYDFAAGVLPKIYFVPLFEMDREGHSAPKLVAGCYLIDCKTARGEPALLIRALNSVAHGIFRNYDRTVFIEALFAKFQDVASSRGYDFVLTATGSAFSNHRVLVAALYHYLCEQPNIKACELEASPETELNGYKCWDPASKTPSVVIWRRLP